MHPSALRFLMLLATVIRPPPSSAQGAALTGTLVGTVSDSASGRGLHRAVLCSPRQGTDGSPTVPCLRADSTGRFRLDSLPAGTHRVEVSCDLPRYGQKTLLIGRLAILPGVETRQDFVVTASGCDERPFSVTRGEFRGHYISAFEESSFHACDGIDDRVWVSFTSGGARTARTLWPPHPGLVVRDEVFVRWQGTLIGPGQYGHMGVAAYQLTVDSVIEVRPFGKHDC